MAHRDQPRWFLRDLPSFGQEKNENPQSRPSYSVISCLGNTGNTVDCKIYDLNA